MRMFFLLEWDNDPPSLEGSKQTPACLSKLGPLETQVSDFQDSCEKEQVQPQKWAGSTSGQAAGRGTRDEAE